MDNTSALNYEGLKHYDKKIKNFIEANKFDPTIDIPAGAIILWSGAESDIPRGWKLCDGRNGTPDLRGKFVLGSGNDYNIGDQGGSETENIKTSSNNGGSLFSSGEDDVRDEINIMPPYYVLAYIMKMVQARDYLYGFDIDLLDENPDTRVSYPEDVDNFDFTPARMGDSTFSYGDWPSTPGEKFMPNPCMLLYNGNVDYYLNPDNYAQRIKGSSSDIDNMSYAGNGMMEWGKIYTKRWEEAGVYHFRCSDVKIDDDYECWSNYDKNDNQIDHFYTPIFDGSWDTNGRMRSISGQAPKVSISTERQIETSKANGEDIWYTEVTADILLIQDLLIMMFKSTNLQESLGYGRVDASDSISSGSMNDKGLFWGSKDMTSGVKAFGMENLWGNLWRRIAGWIYKDRIQLVKLTRGTKDGSDVSDYNMTGDGYIPVPDSTISRSNYISGMKVMPYGRFPIEALGSSSTFECDWVYTSLTDNTYYAIIGGSRDAKSYGGPFYVNFGTEPAIATTQHGSAISCKPLAKI